MLKMYVPGPTAAAEESTSANNLPHYISIGELSLWHKIQEHGKGISKVETGKSLEHWKYWQINHFHEFKKVFLPTFGFDHFTGRCSLPAKQHRQPCRASETLLQLWTSMESS